MNDLTERYDCDVMILGAGIIGSMMGAILARNGADVILIDGVTHPRFAVGEATIPHFLVRLQMLSARYQVPEVTTLEGITTVKRRIGTTFGVKRHFGFVSHQPGEEPDPGESILFGVPRTLYRATHIFRQDADAYMFHTAIKYGCRPRQNWRVADIAFSEDAVTVTGRNGERVRARYLIDATGYRSPVARTLGLRDDPCRLKTHTRTLFTHMIDVPPFDDVIDWSRDQRPPIPWHEGTLHHVFNRGWIWVIPFNNHRRSTNPLCSVGLTVDPRVYPRPADVAPHDEFYQFIERFPAVSRQFKDAKRVREWIATDRLQYSSKRAVGHRWCLMSHAAGFIDPLFSRGMSNSVEVIDALAWRVLESLRDDDFSDARYEYIEELQQGLLSYNDDLVNSSLVAFSNFKLWDTVFRIWGFSSNYGAMRLTSAQLRYQLSGDDNIFRELEKAPRAGFWWPDDPEMSAIWDTMVETIAKYEVGEVSGDDAANRLFGMIVRSSLPPVSFGYKEPRNPHLHPSLLDLARFMCWAVTSGPPNVRSLAVGTLRAMLGAAARRRKAA